ncbi:MgtC/SapB family protein [Rhodoligotrophos appendicifer]|uniref:MgtC/SapB family protein n=1 Tax=Rhodoligotrophos appendicifer TaxID=987056 RepID=UPI00319E3CA8
MAEAPSAAGSNLLHADRGYVAGAAGHRAGYRVPGRRCHYYPNRAKTRRGLTTAANIWATAGIGVIAGLGLEATAVLSAAIILIILAVVPLLIPNKEQ